MSEQLEFSFENPSVLIDDHRYSNHMIDEMTDDLEYALKHNSYSEASDIAQSLGLDISEFGFSEADILCKNNVSRYVKNRRKNHPKLPRQRNVKNPEQHIFLYEACHRSRLNPDNIFESVEAKASQLRNIMGYEILYGPLGTPIPISLAKPERVGKVYRRCYQVGHDLSNERNGSTCS